MNIALFISGEGTTAEAIIKACADNTLAGVRPVCLISSRADAPGIERAKQAGVSSRDIFYIDPGDFETSEAFGEAILKALRKRNADFVGQYGWLPKTPENVIAAYSNMIVNQHPGPLDPGRPDFGGKGMYGRRVHAARLIFVKTVEHDYWTEAVAHRVTKEFDTGVLIKTHRVEVLPDDDVASLQKRMFPIEHTLHIDTIRDFADDKVQEMIRKTPLILENERIILEDAKTLAIQSFPKG